ncbi:E3 ubiquitin-protein ligase bre1, partial [Ceratocystis pirilliformis]
MPVATPNPTTTTLSSVSRVDKMDERKRPASTANNSDEAAPPRKRHAANGNEREDYEKYENQPEEVWITNFTKGAIFRRMHEYRRESQTFSSRLEELHKRSLYHDDHIRIVDAWWRQFVDELELLVDSKVPSADTVPSEQPYLSRVAFHDTVDFQRHLDEKKRSLASRAEALVGRIAASRGQINPNVTTLESEVSTLLAVQKEYLVKLDRLSNEKQELTEQLNLASLRYFKAEKKLDRAKSAQVTELEQQALSRDARSGQGFNGNAEGSKAAKPSTNHAELKAKIEEEQASVKKQQEQIDSLLADIKALQDENTKLRMSKEPASGTEEDFAHTELFKSLRSKTEDLIKQVNHLETTNSQIRDECEKLLAERTAFKRQLDSDTQAVTTELDNELLSRDSDLARIRASRDEHMTELNSNKQVLDQERTALNHLKELVAAKDDKIASLESRIARLEPPAEDQEMADVEAKLDEVPEEELRAKFRKLQRDYDSINHELPSISTAYKKAMALAHNKVMNLEALERKVELILAEKGRVDQKYFAARKDADMRVTEINTMRRQNSKSAEIIAQLKEVETSNRCTMANLEKQLAQLKKANIALAAEHKKLEGASIEATRKSEGALKEVQNLKELISVRDTSISSLRSITLEKDMESSRLKAKVDSLTKDRDQWRRKAEGNSSDVEHNLRTLMLCTICNDKFKDTALKTCGHLFCKACVQDRLTNRMRKCPNCSKAFDKMDIMA